MDVANLLSHDPPKTSRTQQAIETSQHETQRLHQYPTRQTASSHNASFDTQQYAYPSIQQYGNNNSNRSAGYNQSPGAGNPKSISFELPLDSGTNHKARLPMRVLIHPHDTTESIITTVKNFYGLYGGATQSVSFEDAQGNILIPRYENLADLMTVYVRVMSDYSQAWQSQSQISKQAGSPIRAHRLLDEGLQMLPPQPAQILNYGESISRPASRIARKKSASPRPGRSRRSVSAQKARSRSGLMSREDSFQGHLAQLNSDAPRGYSSSDGEGGSVTSSRKARSEQVVNADISLDNVLEGNRRKKAKFESSELPLFVPPQVPAANSISSISPQRRSNGQDNPSPFARPTQRTFMYNQPLHSPQSYGFGDHAYGIVPQARTPLTAAPIAPNGRRLRDRVIAPSLSARSSSGKVPRVQGFGILPTPDPTVASCISDEDVALQLMRLGDASNFSHGRTSASTLDDALSGRADAASSATSDSDEDSDEDEEPSLPVTQARTKLEASPTFQSSAVKKHCKHPHDGLLSMDSIDPSGDDIDDEYTYDGKRDGVFKSDPDDMVDEFGQGVKPRLAGSKQRTASKASSISFFKKISKASKSKSSGIAKKIKPSSLANASRVPLSPTSLPTQSRKTSAASTVNFQHQGEEDLSSKPRCQRCRKSKKGCNRQRPCQRCKDAGLGADQCISEDEGNGRRGRFGRHMGVAVKNDVQGYALPDESDEVGTILDAMSARQEKSKKRKR